jgi:hypothetical protein
MTAWTPERHREMRRQRREAAARRKTESPIGAPGVAELAGAPGGGLCPSPQAATTLSPTDKENAMSTDIICGIAASKFDRLLTDVTEARQRMDDATTGHASAWKALKECDVNTDAVKLCLKLDRQSLDKRSDFLKAFDELRQGKYSHWESQMALPLAVQADDTLTEEEPDEACDVQEDDTPSEVVEMPQPDAPGNQTGDKVEDPANDWAAGPVKDEGATGAVAAFNDGKVAGRTGKEADTNPHDGRAMVGKSWRKGWEAGASELETIKEEGAEARRAGQGMEAAPYISDTDPAGARAWAVGWWKENERLPTGNVVTLHGDTATALSAAQ